MPGWGENRNLSCTEFNQHRSLSADNGVIHVKQEEEPCAADRRDGEAGAAPEEPCPGEYLYPGRKTEQDPRRSGCFPTSFEKLTHLGQTQARLEFAEATAASPAVCGNVGFALKFLTLLPPGDSSKMLKYPAPGRP